MVPVVKREHSEVRRQRLRSLFSPWCAGQSGPPPPAPSNTRTSILSTPATAPFLTVPAGCISEGQPQSPVCRRGNLNDLRFGVVHMTPAGGWIPCRALMDLTPRDIETESVEVYLKRTRRFARTRRTPRGELYKICQPCSYEDCVFPLVKPSKGRNVLAL